MTMPQTALLYVHTAVRYLFYDLSRVEGKVVINNKNLLAHKSQTRGGCEVAKPRPYAKSLWIFMDIYIVFSLCCKLCAKSHLLEYPIIISNSRRLLHQCLIKITCKLAFSLFYIPLFARENKGISCRISLGVVVSLNF